jgi:hypothetical protein
MLGSKVQDDKSRRMIADSIETFKRPQRSPSSGTLVSAVLGLLSDNN